MTASKLCMEAKQNPLQIKSEKLKELGHVTFNYFGPVLNYL